MAPRFRIRELTLTERPVRFTHPFRFGAATVEDMGRLGHLLGPLADRIAEIREGQEGHARVQPQMRSKAGRSPAATASSMP